MGHGDWQLIMEQSNKQSHRTYGYIREIRKKLQKQEEKEVKTEIKQLEKNIANIIHVGSLSKGMYIGPI